MKTDARLRYTKKVLKEALLKALETKPIGKITVKELCDAAEINRATFYKHYTDCADLLESVQEDFLEKFKASGKIDDWSKVEPLINAIFDTIDENMDLCEVLIFQGKSSVLLSRMMEVAYDHGIDAWHAALPQVPRRELDMLFTYLSNGLASVIYRYYKTCDRETLTAFMGKMVQDCFAPYRKQTAGRS